MILKDIQNRFHKELDTIYGKEEVNSFFYLLIESFYNINRIKLALKPNSSISAKEESLIFNALNELKKSNPIQYILGETEFYGLKFKVDKSVLIPRPETEELVALIINNVTSSAVEKSLNILDIGTGSGCIAIALAKHFPNANIYALDVSAEALKVAKQNAKINNADIHFIEADILSDSNSVPDVETKFDVIVSNPPYVRNQEKQQMQDNVLNNEPHLALFVDDENPLLFYKAITKFATKNLNSKGELYFEINEYLGQKTIGLLKDYDLKNIVLKQDVFGKDRMVKGSKI